MTKYVEDFE